MLNEIEIVILLYQQLDKNNAIVSFYYNTQHKVEPSSYIVQQWIIINVHISNSEVTRTAQINTDFVQL